MTEIADRFAHAKASATLSEFVARVTPLTRSGREFVCLCPLKSENTPSFTVTDAKRFWHCFGCGETGDVFDFIQATSNVTRMQALEIVEGTLAQTIYTRPASHSVPEKDLYAALPPGKSDPTTPKPGKNVRVWNPKRDRWSTFRPSAVYSYLARNRKTVAGCVVRIDLKDGNKITPTLRWSHIEGEDAWCMWPFKKPRPLYIHPAKDATRERPVEQVLIVEGEKCADAAARLLPMMHVVTWPGGCQSIGAADWQRLKGRSVVIWPDADDVGVKAASALAELLLPIAKKVKLIATDRAKPKGWDVADAEAEGMLTADVIAWMRERATIVDASSSSPPSRDEASPGDDAPPPERGSEAPAPQQLPEEGGGSSSGEPPPPSPKTTQTLRTVAQEKLEPAPTSVVTLDRRPVTADTLWRMNIINNEDGSPAKRKLTNFYLFLRHEEDTAGLFRLNQWHSRVEVTRQAPWDKNPQSGTRAISDVDYLNAVRWLEKKPRLLSPKPVEAKDAIDMIAHQDAYDPVRDYFTSLQWDRKPRLDMWLTYYLGVVDSPYARLVGAKWMLSGAARALKPGCKADHMLILEGAQGTGKSQALRILGNLGGKIDCYTDELPDIETKDAKAHLRGRLIIEMAEIHQMRQAKIDALKAWLTRSTESYRPVWGRNEIEQPRRCIIAGTVNPDGLGYLQDATGARRFWPVECTTLDLEALEADRDQLWAEAAYRMTNGERHYLADDEVPLANQQQHNRYEEDAWSDTIAKYIENNCADFVWADDIMDKCLFIPKKDFDQRQKRRIILHMRRRGWRHVRRRGDGSVRAWGYEKISKESGDADHVLLDNQGNELS